MRNVHFVGSLGLPDAETAFRTQAQMVGGNAKRYTDGEHGPRSYWIRFQIAKMEAHPDLELVTKKKSQFGGTNVARPYYGPRDGVKAADVKFGATGYAEEAKKSYAIFSKLKSEGVIPAGTRFQVSIPTPLAVIWGMVHPDYQAALEPAYEAALIADVKDIVASIPNEELAIQWDVCQETLAQDGALELHYPDTFDGTIERVNRLAAVVPQPAELGIHLCYGDPGHKHIQEPEDAGTCVRLANAMTKSAPRPITWIHFPVPRERDDDAYFQPLKNLDIPAETELIIGLVHLTDGMDGAKRRIDRALNYVKAFGLSTECGFGRREPDTIADLFSLHREVSEL